MSMTKPTGPEWTILDERQILSCPPFLSVTAQTVALPDGRRVHDYYQLVMPDFALVQAEVPDGRLLMLRSYRHGLRKVCLNFAGGALAAGETAADAARRELREETGFESDRWCFLGSFITNANQGGATAHFFRAVDCRRVAEANSGDLEESELLLITPGEAMAAMRAGGLASLSHVALLMLATHPA